MEVSHRHGHEHAATSFRPPSMPTGRRELVHQRASPADCWMLGLIIFPVLCYFIGGGDGATSAMAVAALALSIELLYLIHGAHRRADVSASTCCTKPPPSHRQGHRQRSQDSEDQSVPVSDDSAEISDDGQQHQYQYQYQYQDNQSSAACRSTTPDISVTLTTSFTEEDRKNHVAKYIHGRIVYPDGSPAHVPAGESATNLPCSFIDFRQGNHEAALAQWQSSQQWRRDRNVYKIHTRPDPCFRAIKKAYPHICHGKSKQGWAVMYEFPGRMDLKRMFHSDISNEDILHHDVFVLEYVANVLHPKIMAASSEQVCSNNWGMIGVLDLTGATLGDFLSRDVIQYLTMIAKVSDAHYPLHVKKLFMINAPFWMAHFFKVIKPILPKTLVIEVLSGKDYDKALREYIDDDELAQEFGGSSPYKLGEHPYELDLVKLAMTGVDPRGGAPVDVVNIQQEAPKKQVLLQAENLPRDDVTAFDTNTETTADATRRLHNAERLCWPVRLPSLCSTVLSSYSREEGDGVDECSIGTSSDGGNRPVRPAIMRHSGPLRSRLPSFEPIVSPDEEKWVMESFMNNRTRASTETSSMEEFDRFAASVNSDDMEEGEETLSFTFFGCDSLFSSVLATCG